MLKQQIQKETAGAVKSGNELVVSALRLLLAAIISKEKEKRYKLAKSNPDIKDLDEKSSLTDEEVMNIISSEMKKRKEAILMFEKGARPELADKEKKEMGILMKYMPEQLSEEELRKIIKDAIEKTGAKEMKDMGKIMTVVMPQVKGRADGSEISRIAKELF